MENYNVKEINGNLGREKINKNLMNLTNKEFMDLTMDELKREIDYLWGQYDYIFECEYIPKDIKDKQLKYLWNQIDVITIRLIGKSFEKTTNDIKEMRKSWQS